MKNKYIFFRNDDVRDTLDDSLIKITEICIKQGMPISHAVEPANISPEVVEWLIKMKINHTDLIDIVQHGYKHNLNYQRKVGKQNFKGEFGGDRSYEEQYIDIKKGMKIMDDYFGEKWLKVFTFSFGSYNLHSLNAIKELSYFGISSGSGYDLKTRIKNKIGVFWGREFLKNHISELLNYRVIRGSGLGL